MAEAFSAEPGGPEAGVSIGCVFVTGAEEPLITVLSAADAALYAAKRSGRGRISTA